jgi:dTDP-4-amino-4,6-dideoxygalactose transaminase
MSTSKLALLGGEPLIRKPFQFNKSIGAEEKRAVMEVLDSGELSGFIATAGEAFNGGPRVRALQQAFEAHYGMRHALGFNSATSALHAAASAMGIGPGDEVITSPWTMSATASAILFTGAVPVFADIEDESFGLDPASVQARITPRTRGIFTVNIFGHPCKLGPLREIADRHGLFLVEDNAQAPDALYSGRYTGTIGDAAVFSFNRHKVIQSGEGGVLVTNDDTIALKAALLRNHGEAVVEAMGVTDIVNTVGLNLRMTEMEAAVALEQFRKLQKLNGERIRLADRLTAGLREIPGLTPPVVGEDCRHVYYMFPIGYDARETGLHRDLFVEAMIAEGAAIRAGYLKPMYREPAYRQRIAFGRDGFPFSANARPEALDYHPSGFPTCERLANSDFVLTYIMQPPQTDEDMDLFVAACRKVLDNKQSLIGARRPD